MMLWWGRKDALRILLLTMTCIDVIQTLALLGAISGHSRMVNSKLGLEVLVMDPSPSMIFVGEDYRKNQLTLSLMIEKALLMII
jgi:hypothetical protein